LDILKGMDIRRIELDLQDIKTLNELSGHLMMFTINGNIQVESYIPFVNKLIAKYKSSKEGVLYLK
jgi:hypothetical protein